MKLDLYFNGKTVNTAKSTFKVGPNEKEKMKLMRDVEITTFIDFGIEPTLHKSEMFYDYWTKEYNSCVDFSDENGVICAMTTGYPLGDIVEKLLSNVGEERVAKVLLDSIKKTYEYYEKKNEKKSRSEVCI